MCDMLLTRLNVLFCYYVNNFLHYSNIFAHFLFKFTATIITHRIEKNNVTWYNYCMLFDKRVEDR